MCVTSFVLYKCNFSFSPKVVQFGIETKFLLIASLCSSVIDSDSVVTENQCLVGDHYLYSCDLNVWFRGDIVGRN